MEIATAIPWVISLSFIYDVVGYSGASWEQNIYVFLDVEINKLSLHICFHRTRMIESL
jgi:hypothetical protein